ncbi:hypothetical protein ACP6JD_000839 [Aspergillus fumigatus]
MDPVAQDNQFHLTGTTHILNTMSSFGSSGGLGEAAAWLCLREDMYISLTSQSPLQTNLQSFERSDVFTRTDDFAWSNRMVFLLARILSCAFNEESRTRRSCASLKALEKEVDDWSASKPQTFQPVHFAPRGKDPGRRFPTIWTLLPVHGMYTPWDEHSLADPTQLSVYNTTTSQRLYLRCLVARTHLFHTRDCNAHGTSKYVDVHHFPHGSKD